MTTTQQQYMKPMTQRQLRERERREREREREREWPQNSEVS